jgi:hypothetical protein
MAVIGGTEIVASFRLGGGGVTSLNGLTGVINIVAGANTTVTPGAGTITIAAFGTIAGSIAANQVAVGSGANTIAGSANFTWNAGTQALSIIGIGGASISMNSAGTSIVTGADSGAIGLPSSGTASVLISPGAGKIVSIGSLATFRTFQYNDVTGYTTWNGATSGGAAIGVASAAGTPNPILLPIAAGAAGTFLQTDGGNPQQTSWVAAGGTTLVASGTATLSVTAIPANTAQTVVTVAATGVLATDSIEWAFNAIPGIGYNQGLFVLVYPSAGNVNFLVVNGTANAYTPGAAVLNWRVIR